MNHPTNIPCPYANGKPCTWHVVCVEAYKADIAWTPGTEGRWHAAISVPRSHSRGYPDTYLRIPMMPADGRVIHGTPDTVIPKLRRVLEETRPSIYGLWGNDGSVSNTAPRSRRNPAQHLRAVG